MYKKYHFAENLLSQDNFDNYCTKIVVVKQIKYFSKGCEVSFVTKEDGIEGIKGIKKQIIYRNTTNYDMLMKKLNELYIEN